MSSILKALEKVETDLASQTRRQEGSGAFQQIRAAVPPRQRKTRLLSGRVWMAICLIAVTAAAWLLAVKGPGWKDKPGPQSMLTEKREKTESAAAGPADDPQASGRPTRNGPATANPAVADTRPAEALRQPPIPRPPAGNPAGQGPPVPGETALSVTRPATPPAVLPESAGTSGLASGRQRPASPPPVSAREQRLPQATPPGRRTPQTRSEAISPTIPLLRAADLKLHAIAWSPEPSQRMAVINNSVTREGDTIEGFAVLLITEDEILVRKDREKWRLMLRR